MGEDKLNWGCYPEHLRPMGEDEAFAHTISQWPDSVVEEEGKLQQYMACRDNKDAQRLVSIVVKELQRRGLDDAVRRVRETYG